MEEREARKRARMERNRLSAARHRQQQRDLIASLQQQLAAALAENDRLRRGLPVPGSPIVTTEPAVFTLFSTPSSGIVCDDRRAGAAAPCAAGDRVRAPPIAQLSCDTAWPAHGRAQLGVVHCRTGRSH